MEDPERSCLHIGEVLATTVLADMAWTNMALLRRPTGTLADLAMGSMLTYGPTCDDGWWWHERR